MLRHIQTVAVSCRTDYLSAVKALPSTVAESIQSHFCFFHCSSTPMQSTKILGGWPWIWKGCKIRILHLWKNCSSTSDFPLWPVSSTDLSSLLPLSSVHDPPALAHVAFGAGNAPQDVISAELYSRVDRPLLNTPCFQLEMPALSKLMNIENMERPHWIKRGLVMPSCVESLLSPTVKTTSSRHPLHKNENIMFFWEINHAVAVWVRNSLGRTLIYYGRVAGVHWGYYMTHWCAPIHLKSCICNLLELWSGHWKKFYRQIQSSRCTFCETTPSP